MLPQAETASNAGHCVSPVSNRMYTVGRPASPTIKEHMEDQDRRSESQPNGAQEPPNGTHADGQPTSADDTQVGQVLQGLAKVTRQLPAVPAAPSRRTDARAIQQATRERIAALIVALGDPSNSLHQHAVDDLVAIGDAAVPA